MPDTPTVEPLHFTQHTIRTVESWPERTSITDDGLRQPHLIGAKKATDEDGNPLLVFDIFNGSATYRILNERDPGGAVICELIAGAVTRRKV